MRSVVRIYNEVGMCLDYQTITRTRLKHLAVNEVLTAKCFKLVRNMVKSCLAPEKFLLIYLFILI